MKQIVKVFFPLISIFFLISCGNYAEKTFVYESHELDEHGEPIITYKECSAMNLFNLDPACHVETVHPKYCYYSLGQIECHVAPLSQNESPRRVK